MAQTDTKSQSKLKEIKPTIKPWKQLNTNRKNQVKIDRLRLGHTKITHSYLFSAEVQPICEKCNKTLTVEHVLLKCTLYDQERNSNNLPNDLKIMLSENCNTYSIVNYLKQTQLYYKL